MLFNLLEVASVVGTINDLLKKGEMAKLFMTESVTLYNRHLHVVTEKTKWFTQHKIKSQENFLALIQYHWRPFHRFFGGGKSTAVEAAKEAKSKRRKTPRAMKSYNRKKTYYYKIHMKQIKPNRENNFSVVKGYCGLNTLEETFQGRKFRYHLGIREGSIGCN